MTPPTIFSKRLGLLLIALFGALLVFPAGAVLASGAATSGGAGVGSGGAAPAAAPTGPSLAPATTPIGSPALLHDLPANLRSVPWIQNLARTGPTLDPLTSLPNLGLLEHPLTANGTINPFYVAQPAPLGLADFGLGATPYSYNTSHILGTVTINAPPDVTDPASTGVILPSGTHLGFVGSVHEFGVQLNTVVQNMSIPGSDDGVFWTQNVVDWNATAIHFVSDTFNMTSATQNPYYIAPGTIFSACHNGSAGVDRILFVYGGVFQCVGPNVPISPASYPITLALYNNATVNAQKRTVVTYGFNIYEAGTHTDLSGITDAVVFNNPTPYVTPANPPAFSIDGLAPSPTGLFRDAEIDLAGDIGGDNSVFRAINGSITLQYSNASHGGFRPVPSAYNFGGDTGETATGVADYWTASHTLVVNQGPAMLYGLWGAAPWVSVRSGSIHVAGSISPDYGFVFVSNTPPVLDPWGTGARDNMSWLPTTSTGTFSTWLPPTGAPWAAHYYVQAFADGYAELNGTPITKATTTLHLRLKVAPGNLDAPFYMFGNAQAAALAKALTGSASAPYVFNGLTANMNTTFNHLNDYAFPDFVLLLAQGVTNPIDVNNTYQGADSPLGNFYIVDYVGPSTGLLVPAPLTYGPLPYFTSGIEIFNGAGDRITNQTLAAAGYGLQLVLWQDSHVHAQDLQSIYESSGVWIGASTNTTVTDVTATTCGDALTDVASFGTHANGLAALAGLGTYPYACPSVGVEAYGSSDATVSNVYVGDGATGVSAGINYGAETDFDPYYYVPGAFGLSVHGLEAVNGSLGANVSLSGHVAFDDVTALNGSLGVIFDEAPQSTASHVRAGLNATGVEVLDTHAVAVTDLLAVQDSTGVVVVSSSSIDLRSIAAHDRSTAVSVVGSNQVHINYVAADDYSLGVYLDNDTNVTIGHVAVRGHSTGVFVA